MQLDLGEAGRLACRSAGEPSIFLWDLDCSGGWESYSGLHPFLQALTAAAAVEAPGLLNRYQASLKRVLGRKSGTAPPAGLLEQNDPRLLLRRLSREGVSLAHDVDGTARFVAEARSACPSLRGPWRVRAKCLASLDRPSLRVLARLARVEGAPRWMSLEENSDRGAALPARAQPGAPSYQRLVATVRERWNVAPRNWGRRNPPIEPASGDFARAFAHQNYEAAFAALGATADGALLMRALLLVNLGRAADALVELDRAMDRGDEPLASLHYLCGLIRTKSCPDWTRAGVHYEAGLELVRGGDQASRMERAWLLNGRALLRTLAALRGEPTRRRGALVSVLREQEAILDLSLAGDRPETLYLRYNILANTTLLLEAMGLYPEAHHFWERAFGPLLAEGPERPSAAAVLPYFYRKGVLALKSGDIAGAASDLERASELAVAPATRLLASRTFYALAGAEAALGRRVAARRRMEHALAAAADEDDAGQQALVEAAASQLALTGNFAASPPSKLPSYLPHIDLDPEPGNGLNERLARAAAP